MNILDLPLKDRMLKNRKILFDLILSEHAFQVGKWGIQKHGLFTWLAFATEELGETSMAISEYLFRNGSKENIVKEAIQTATLCLKIAEMCLQDETRK